MRTWVIFALLSVIVAAAAPGEAAAVREPSFITALDKAVKKVESLLQKRKQAADEKSFFKLPSLKGPLGNLGSLIPSNPFAPKKPAPPAEAPVVNGEDENINVVNNDDANQDDDNEEDVDEEADNEEADNEEVDNKEAENEEAANDEDVKNADNDEDKSDDSANEEDDDEDDEEEK